MENAVYSFSKMMMEFWRIYKYKWLKIESNLSLSLEKKRLSGENVSQNVSQKVDNPSDTVGIE